MSLARTRACPSPRPPGFLAGLSLAPRATLGQRSPRWSVQARPGPPDAAWPFPQPQACVSTVSTVGLCEGLCGTPAPKRDPRVQASGQRLPGRPIIDVGPEAAECGSVCRSIGDPLGRRKRLRYPGWAGVSGRRWAPEAAADSEPGPEARLLSCGPRAGARLSATVALPSAISGPAPSLPHAASLSQRCC
ncbi:hypothetical protein PtA15_18A293 [Puccinia triticina]|uniref:Uncharacterized protein n=1 Tax=Puccinia triticina TaxID=208348 RepID=A0ABY7D7L0_9BASI|nr:uncharacterized protein PtA15_18A293 [Puccinia triticina]WAQ93235.1 hypothetical protein PtA15_18A293 [Puccinia triticina]WAR63216.1 hypothetical protein PtB15_18B298 [Puccinia triticina]